MKTKQSQQEILHLTLADAARRHSVAPWFLRKSIWDGQLKAVLAGRRYIISTRDLDNFFAARTV